MNISELDKYELSKAIEFHNELNPQLYYNGKMRPEIRKQLLKIADDFREFLGIEDIALVDITVSGSNAAYSYTPHSDIDLHLIVDFDRLPHDEVFRELFDAKKYQYNDLHDIKIKGYDVELYVQDKDQPHSSLGEYSVLRDEWNRIPTKKRANLDDIATFQKYEKLKELAIRALASDNEKYLNHVLDIIKRYRKAGLSKKGEFSPENLAFKMLRTDGYFQKLWDKKREFEDKRLSLEHNDDGSTDEIVQELSEELKKGFSRKRVEQIFEDITKSNPSLFDKYSFDQIYKLSETIATLEASYEGNIGAMEVFDFYQKGTKKQIDLLTKLIAAHKYKEAWQLIQKVTGTKLKGKEFAVEGVGLIRKGSNVTPDVGEAQTRIEAEKLGFKTTNDGVPPLLKTNGKKSKILEGIKLLNELKMSPKYLEKEVKRIEKKYGPVIGVEFEVIFPSEKGNPKITWHTTLDDIKDFFEYNTDSDFEFLEQDYNSWLFKKSDEWIEKRVDEIVDYPLEEEFNKIEYITDEWDPDYSIIDLVTEITGDENDADLTEDQAKQILRKAQQSYKEYGNASEWDYNKLDTESKLYYEIFIEEKDKFKNYIYNELHDEFANSEVPNGDEYTIGRFLLEKHINNMGDLYFQYQDDLIWTGGALYSDKLDPNLTSMLENDLSSMGYDVEISDAYAEEADSSKVWVIKPDQSITPDDENDQGIEITMPPTPYDEGIWDLERVIEYLKSKGAYTNSSTGFHINISFSKIDNSKIDYVKLVLLLGDEYVLKQFGRELNSYAASTLKHIQNLLNPESAFERDRQEVAEAFAKVIKNMKYKINRVIEDTLENKLKLNKYVSVNPRGDYVEFRSPGGEDYLDDFDKIVNTINRFIVAYAAAADPEAYKKEYGKKLYKLLSSITNEKKKDIVSIFAGFSSGMIDKDELKKLLLSKTESENQPKNKIDAIQQIADKYNIDDEIASLRFLEGLEVEMPKYNNEEKANNIVFKNLMKDIDYYRR